MPSFLPSENIYQQTRSGHNKNIPKHNITTYLTFSSQQAHTLNMPQQKTTMNHSQEHSEFILFKMKLFPCQKHQNHMSKSLHTGIKTTDLTLLFMLSFLSVLIQEYLEPNIKTLLSPFALVKQKLFLHSISELFDAVPSLVEQSTLLNNFQFSTNDSTPNPEDSSTFTTNHYQFFITASTAIIVNTNNNNNSTIFDAIVANASVVNPYVIVTRVAAVSTKEKPISCFSTGASKSNNTPTPPHPYVFVIPHVHSAKM